MEKKVDKREDKFEATVHDWFICMTIGTTIYLCEQRIIYVRTGVVLQCQIRIIETLENNR